ncbi:hypothetical protein [Streptomyces flavofungini]|uniref:hypothetical protein n=1 Tax=Streptomyces flavofungini TaxID=68200 RepID=UPI0034E02AC8
MTTVEFPLTESTVRPTAPETTGPGISETPDVTVPADAEVVMAVGVLFDVVVFPAGRRGLAVIHELDATRPRHCGPVVATLGEGRQPDRYFALVPPGTAMDWVSPDARCFGRGTIRLPERTRQAPPGRYWMRPFTSEATAHLICPASLRRALDRHRPYPLDRFRGRPSPGGKPGHADAELRE